MEYVTRYSVRQICDILEIELPTEYNVIADDILTNISYHARFLQEGGAFFIAGKNYEERERKIRQALEANAKIIFCGRLCSNVPLINEIPHIIIDNVFGNVIRLSAHIRNELGIKVVGITGSVGKTTTKDMVFSVLDNGFYSEKSKGNENTIFPLFNNMQKLPLDTEFFVQEFGAATPTVMPKTVRACIPDAGIITNIMDAHLDAFVTRENILKEKIQMITQMPAGCPAFLNYDDELLRTVKLDDHPVIFYSTKSDKADYYADNLEYYSDHMKFDVVHNGHRSKVRLNVCGEHNVSNAVVAFAVGEWAGMRETDIVYGLANHKSTGIRQNLTNIGGYKLYIDCYNTGSVPIQGAIQTMERMKLEPGGKRVAVLSEIRCLGDSSQDIHRETGEKIGQLGVDLVLCFGNEDAKLMADNICKYGKEVLYTDNREQLNQWIQQMIKKEDITLYKGAHVRILHKTIDQVYGTSFHVDHCTEFKEIVKQNDYKCDMLFEEDGSGKLAALTKYFGQQETLVLPSTIDGTDIFSVSKNCFLKNDSLTEVVIPAPISNISVGAFNLCKNLKKVTLPETLKFIGDKAFRYCSSLEEVVIPEGVMHIGDEAFLYCKSLKRVVLPSTLGRIGENAFPKFHKVNFEVTPGSYAEKYIQNMKSGRSGFSDNMKGNDKNDKRNRFARFWRIQY